MESPIRNRQFRHGQRRAPGSGRRGASDIQYSVAIPLDAKPEPVQPDRPDPHFLVKQRQERDSDFDLIRRGDISAPPAGVNVRQYDMQARKESH